MRKGIPVIIFLLYLLLFCAGCTKSETACYNAGMYTASAEGYAGQVFVEVEFDESSILSVRVTSHSETKNLGDRAVEEIPLRIVDAQTWNVDAITSATITSEAIQEAVKDCIKQAAAN